ncbi:hypothetical protein FNH08_46730, partial [Streptomyces spongiae]|nr:hypothetical protein [Streptomyces spongiae]
MTNQPYGTPYEGYDPYQQPSWQDSDEAQAAQAQQYTQQWEGQTWETQAHPPVAAVDATETAYLPPQGAAAQQAGQGVG